MFEMLYVTYEAFMKDSESEYKYGRFMGAFNMYLMGTNFDRSYVKGMLISRFDQDNKVNN